MVKIVKKIFVVSVLSCMSFAFMGVSLRQHCSKDIILTKLQQQVLDATNNAPGFDLSIENILKSAAQKFANEPDCFEELIFTRDDDQLSIITHLVIEEDPSALIEAMDTIHKFYGTSYEPIARLLRHRDDRGRSALYFAVLRKKNDMLAVLLNKAQEIFGDDKKEFLLFINGENKKGHREKLNYRTPFILAAYNDDPRAVELLLRSALTVFGKHTKNFDEFLHARDANGATAAFYAGDNTKKVATKLHVELREF